MPPVMLALSLLDSCKGYQESIAGISNGVCEHASSAFIFASTTAVINFLMRAASTLEITNGEQRAFRKFSANWNLSLLKLSVVLHHVVWPTLSKLDYRSKATQHDKTLSLFNHSK